MSQSRHIARPLRRPTRAPPWSAWQRGAVRRVILENDLSTRRASTISSPRPIARSLTFTGPSDGQQGRVLALPAF
jgi:hypothetical protein